MYHRIWCGFYKHNHKEELIKDQQSRKAGEQLKAGVYLETHQVISGLQPSFKEHRWKTKRGECSDASFCFAFFFFLA
jgi:hypothetical protein